MTINLRSSDIRRNEKTFNRALSPDHLALVELAFKNYVSRRSKSSEVIRLEWERFSTELYKLIGSKS